MKIRDFRELKVSVNARLERLKVICSQENGQEKRVAVSRSHRDKRVGECVCRVSMQFNRVGVVYPRKSYISHKKPFGKIVDFISSEQTAR